LTVIEKENEIYHDEHDCTVKISNDNTKHQKTISVTLRYDFGKKSLKDVVDLVNEAYNHANTGGE